MTLANSQPNALLDKSVADAFDVEDMDDLIEPPVEPKKEVSSAVERGLNSKCDPNQPPDPASFGGQESVTKKDLPDPQCEKQPDCSSCLANRECGWCAAADRCTMSRSKSPECAFNENTDVCAPPCPDMWRLNWPEGRLGVVSKFCAAVAEEYKIPGSGKVVHFRG